MKSQTLSLEAAWNWIREGGQGSICSIDGFAALVVRDGKRFFIFEAGEPVRFYSLRHTKQRPGSGKGFDEKLIFE